MKIFKIIGIVLGLVALVLLNLFFSYTLPFPFSKVNIIFVFLIITMLRTNSGFVVWLSFLIHLFIELHSVTPFGVVILSSTLSILFTYWFYQTIFTNRSLYATIGLSIVSLLLYRVLYIFLLSGASIFIESISVSWSLIITTFLWEILFTGLLIVIVYLVMFPFGKKNKFIASKNKTFRF